MKANHEKQTTSGRFAMAQNGKALFGNIFKNQSCNLTCVEVQTKGLLVLHKDNWCSKDVKSIRNTGSQAALKTLSQLKHQSFCKVLLWLTVSSQLLNLFFNQSTLQFQEYLQDQVEYFHKPTSHGQQALAETNLFNLMQIAQRWT